MLAKKTWTENEDIILRQLVYTYGKENWTKVSENLTERSGKQCRERWHNHLDPAVIKGNWTAEEDQLIVTMQKLLGNQWIKITKMLPGRTDNAVKNRFHSIENARIRNQDRGVLSAEDAYAIFLASEALGSNHGVNGSSRGEIPVDIPISMKQQHRPSSLTMSRENADSSKSQNHFQQHHHQRSADYDSDEVSSIIGSTYHDHMNNSAQRISPVVLPTIQDNFQNHIYNNNNSNFGSSHNDQHISLPPSFPSTQPPILHYQPGPAQAPPPPFSSSFRRPPLTLDTSRSFSSSSSSSSSAISSGRSEATNTSNNTVLMKKPVPIIDKFPSPAYKPSSSSSSSSAAAAGTVRNGNHIINCVDDITTTQRLSMTESPRNSEFRNSDMFISHIGTIDENDYAFDPDYDEENEEGRDSSGSCGMMMSPTQNRQYQYQQQQQQQGMSSLPSENLLVPNNMATFNSNDSNDNNNMSYTSHHHNSYTSNSSSRKNLTGGYGNESSEYVDNAGMLLRLLVDKLPPPPPSIITTTASAGAASYNPSGLVSMNAMNNNNANTNNNTYNAFNNIYNGAPLQHLQLPTPPLQHQQQQQQQEQSSTILQLQFQLQQQRQQLQQQNLQQLQQQLQQQQHAQQQQQLHHDQLPLLSHSGRTDTDNSVKSPLYNAAVNNNNNNSIHSHRSGSHSNNNDDTTTISTNYSHSNNNHHNSSKNDRSIQNSNSNQNIPSTSQSFISAAQDMFCRLYTPQPLKPSSSSLAPPTTTTPAVAVAPDNYYTQQYTHSNPHSRLASPALPLSPSHSVTHSVNSSYTVSPREQFAALTLLTASSSPATTARTVVEVGNNNYNNNSTIMYPHYPTNASSGSYGVSTPGVIQVAITNHGGSSSSIKNNSMNTTSFVIPDALPTAATATIDNDISTVSSAGNGSVCDVSVTAGSAIPVLVPVPGHPYLFYDPLHPFLKTMTQQQQQQQ